jgi:hypothetical protein
MAAAPSAPPASYTELGFQIRHFKFAVRIPKLRRPKLLKKRPVENRVDWASEIQKRYREELKRYGRESTTASSGNAATSSSLDSYDWMRDFHSRYNPVVSSVPDASAVSPAVSDNPERTSTPLSLTIQPLNRMVRDCEVARRLDFLDMSGVKIYENLEEPEQQLFNSHGSSEKSASSSDLSDDSYEIVSVVDHKVIAIAKFKPRTLKSNGGTLRRGNLV